jgi:two-component system OmpR family response regulator
MPRTSTTTPTGPPPTAGTGPAASSPQAAHRAPFTARSPRVPRRQQRLRVLLVEDSPLLVQRITELIEDLPNVTLVGTAGSEAQAVERLGADDVDVVILDLQLQTGSGFGVLRALQGRPRAAPAVVVFTNFAIGAYRDTALALGARHFLDKSRDYARLPTVLQELSESVQ